jgi:hypothetical protein
MPSIQTCPHCGAPLAITRFAATVVCSYCDATVRVDPSSVSASRYREAWKEWNNATPADGARAVAIGETRWLEERLLAHGEVSDVYLAKRARWPSELVVLKVLRDSGDAPLLLLEWGALTGLHAGAVAAGVDLGSRVPAPVAIDTSAAAYRWAGGFTHTLEMVRNAHPDGVPPVISIWVWRRILEILGVMRRLGAVHGAILPNHVLVENGEHGLRLVGFSCADVPHAPLRAISTDFEGFYPASMLDSGKLTSAADLVMSARCVSYLLGGDHRDVPDHVPAPLAELLRRVAADDEHRDLDPWGLHKELGKMGRALFGPPAFHPIEMSGKR